MFKDRVFSVSFLVSFLWHAFWIAAVSIITVPTGLKEADYTKVYFLGPILEETAFEMMLDESKVHVETLYRKPVLPGYAFDVEIESPGGELLEGLSAIGDILISDFAPKNVIREDKIASPHFFREGPSFIEEVSASESPIEGRPVTFRPDKIPAIPAWISEGRGSYKIELEFTVSPEGTVKRIKPVVSSGYPQIDMIGMDYLKKWRFTPKREEGKDLDQVGTVEIELKVD